MNYYDILKRKKSGQWVSDEEFKFMVTCQVRKRANRRVFRETMRPVYADNVCYGLKTTGR